MKVKCILRYANDPRSICFAVGETFDADPALWAFLRADAPGCFEVVPEKPKRKQAKPRNKAVQAAPIDK